MPGFIKLVKETAVVRTPRVLQVEGIFDTPPSEQSREEWEVHLDLPIDWNIGVIVGPSGSGKTTVANALWPDKMLHNMTWDADKSILDSFPADMSVREIVDLLSNVGFSSPPSWVRPFRVLSNGEQFRVMIARLLAEHPDLAVVDEFSSVVDRTVAQIGSAAIQKTVRRRGGKFIAVTCHYDVLDWLEPDWVYKPQTDELIVGRHLRRPEINLTVKRVHSDAWHLFKRHHYLTASLNHAAYCFVAWIGDVPVAFSSAISFPHPSSPGWRLHRTVCLPDYQGIGIGSRLSDHVAAIMAATGKPVRRTLTHPALIHACRKSPVWREIRGPGTTSAISSARGIKEMRKTHASMRFTVSFEYTGVAMDRDAAYAMLGKLDTKNMR